MSVQERSQEGDARWEMAGGMPGGRCLRKNVDHCNNYNVFIRKF